MAWELEIHQIDVEQGESALIIAKDEKQKVYRTMLIDGGLQDKAKSIAAYLDRKLPSNHRKIDCTVTTHWDEDHSYGMTALFIGDNITKLRNALVKLGAEAYVRATNYFLPPAPKKTILWVAIEAAYYCLGGFKLDSDRIAFAKNKAKNAKLGNLSVELICSLAIRLTKKEFETNSSINLEPSLFNKVILTHAVQAVTLEACKAKPTKQTTYTSVKKFFSKKVGPNFQFDTKGFFNGTLAVDIGDIEGGSGVLATYQKAVAGRLTLSNSNAIQIPGINRKRFAPKINHELLWNDGSGNSKIPKGAPAIYVFAIRGQARDGKNVKDFNGNIYNKMSIGMVFKFNNFVFFSGGDLPYQGEDIVGADLVSSKVKPWPEDWDPTHCCALKCSHHGSEESTKAQFIKAIKPNAATISCGPDNEFDHPRQEVIDVLYGASSKPQVYMTACSFERNHVPKFSEDQLTSGNRFFVAGDPSNRGDILIKVTEAQSLSQYGRDDIIDEDEDDVRHGFNVEYYDKDQPQQNSIKVGGTRCAIHDHDL